MQQLQNKNVRIESVDSLRGFAILAILLVHSLNHFNFPVFPTGSPEWLNTIDFYISKVLFILFDGKAYAIFALLFGFTFYIQSNNQKLKGKDFGYRFLWRMVLLVAFATINAAFFSGWVFSYCSLFKALPFLLHENGVTKPYLYPQSFSYYSLLNGINTSQISFLI